MENNTSPMDMARTDDIKTSVLVVGVLFIVLSVCVVFGNALVIISIRRFQRLKTLTNRMVLSLALADFIAGLFIFWQSCFSWFPQLESSGTACLFRFVNMQPSLCSSMHLVCIAVDRYVAVLHPLRYNEFVTPKVVNILLSVAWGSSILLTGIVIGTAKYNPSISLCTLPDVVSHAIIMVMHTILTSLIVAMFFIYGRIFLVARKQMKQIHALSAPSGLQENRGNRIARELKAAGQLSVVVLVFFICHATFLVTLGLGYIYRELMPIPTFILCYKVSLFVVFCNSALNPIVYALNNREFRAAFKRLLCSLCLTGNQRNMNNNTLYFSDQSNGVNE